MPRNKPWWFFQRLLAYFFGVIALGAMAGESLYVELVINENNTGRVVEVFRNDEHWTIARQDLLELGLLLPEATQDYFSLSDEPGVQVRFSSSMQRLYVEFPQRFFPLKTYGATRHNQRFTSSGGRGAYL